MMLAVRAVISTVEMGAGLRIVAFIKCWHFDMNSDYTETYTYICACIFKN